MQTEGDKQFKSRAEWQQSKNRSSNRRKKRRRSGQLALVLLSSCLLQDNKDVECIQFTYAWGYIIISYTQTRLGFGWNICNPKQFGTWWWGESRSESASDGHDGIATLVAPIPKSHTWHVCKPNTYEIWDR